MIKGNVTAKDNYVFRKTNDSRIPFGMSALKGHHRGISLPHESFSYGRANRPQTPLGGIITNNFGEMAGAELQSKYKQIQVFKGQNSPKNKIEVRYTNAKMKAEEFIKTKNSFDFNSSKNEFKLKRF